MLSFLRLLMTKPGRIHWVVSLTRHPSPRVGATCNAPVAPALTSTPSWGIGCVWRIRGAQIPTSSGPPIHIEEEMCITLPEKMTTRRPRLLMYCTCYSTNRQTASQNVENGQILTLNFIKCYGKMLSHSGIEERRWQFSIAVKTFTARFWSSSDIQLHLLCLMSCLFHYFL